MPLSVWRLVQPKNFLDFKNFKEVIFVTKVSFVGDSTLLARLPSQIRLTKTLTCQQALFTVTKVYAVWTLIGQI